MKTLQNDRKNTEKGQNDKIEAKYSEKTQNPHLTQEHYQKCQSYNVFN